MYLYAGTRANVVSAAQGLLRRTSPEGRPLLLFTGAVMSVVALAVAIGTVDRTGLVLAGLALIVVLSLILFRLDVAVAILAASFFFNAYLNHGAGILTIDKGIGLLAVFAWLLEWSVNRRQVLGTRQLWLLGAFLLWTGLSMVVAMNEKAALVTSLRYLTFAILFFLVIQTVRGDRRRADALVNLIVVAAAVASLIGLVAFLDHHVARASGPIQDPNDFGFVLSSSVPLAIYQVRWASTAWAKALRSVALVLILACTLATFSRDALTGLAVAAVWAVVTRRLRLRWLLAVLACAATVGGVALLVTPHLVQTAFDQKAHVAKQNVDVRFGYYHVELDEFAHYPITGVGPGNFVYRFYQFAPQVHQGLPYPSHVLTISGEEAYLVVLAEQGAPGLVLFLGYMALSWTDLRRRFPQNQRTDQLHAALAAGFVIAVVGALFLTEQFYPPLWFLPAVAVGLASGMPDAGPDDLGVIAGHLGASSRVPAVHR
jgi:putative inorganic carbon (hco3(-)) transporter